MIGLADARGALVLDVQAGRAGGQGGPQALGRDQDGLGPADRRTATGWCGTISALPPGTEVQPRRGPRRPRARPARRGSTCAAPTRRRAEPARRDAGSAAPARKGDALGLVGREPRARRRARSCSSRRTASASWCATCSAPTPASTTSRRATSSWRSTAGRRPTWRPTSACSPRSSRARRPGSTCSARGPASSFLTRVYVERRP